MEGFFSRTELLFGREAIEKLKNSRVAVFGIGGVGGYVVEALVRSGIGEMDLIDSDTICPSNMNRQIIATQKNIGEYKVDVAAKRIEDINPNVIVHKHKVFFLPDTVHQFDFREYDYVVDAIDTVTGKLQLVETAHQWDTPIISSMGAGNKVDPTAFEVADISKTSVCPLAKVMRRELKKRGIQKLKVVYSKEPALTPLALEADTASYGATPMEGQVVRRRMSPGSTAFVPSVAGLILAGEVIKDLINYNR